MKTILVVEDFLHARHLICNKLRSQGYHTLGAASVQEACDMLAHEAGLINLVLSDVDMPDTKGFDLLRTIKNNPVLEDIPVVFWATDYQSRLDTESTSFNQRPFRDEKFFKEIDRAINTKGCMINLAS